MGFVDLHAHVLPALDDGVKSVAEAVEVVGMLGRLGFDVICCTPHQKVGSWVPSSASISKARADVAQALAAGDVGVELRLGAENFWDELFVQRCVEGGLPTYSGERAFLVEVSPVNPPVKLEEQLFRLRTRGPLPVLAHPERYHGLCKQPDGLAHACASDAHDAEDARAAGQGIAWLRKRMGEAVVKRLLDENPRRILQGELPD